MIFFAGQQFEYFFDHIGNRTKTRSGGDNHRIKRRLSTYTPNQLNQYSSRKVPGSVDIIGTAHADSTVTVDTTATQRKGDYFRADVTLDNSAGPVYQNLTVRGVRPDAGQDVMTEETRSLVVPPATQTFTYDDDGNLTADGIWTYTWDGENRLIRMVANTAVGPQQRIDFEYDWLGRRIRKRVWNNTAGTDPVALDQKFIYDGWNLIAVLVADNSRLQSFTWGYDLSGTLQGAGGVGGLKAVTVHTGPEAGTYFCAYDGNGNVAGLVSAANGNIAAQYEYGPFGEVIRATGPMAKMNVFRFSTKYQDDETDFLYYGHRYYSASNGRWSSRDPITERGGINLYAIGRNQSQQAIDYLGLLEIPIISPFCKWIADKLVPIPPSPPRPSTDNNKTYTGQHVVVTTAFTPSDQRDLRWHIETGQGGNGQLQMRELSIKCCDDCRPIKCVIHYTARVAVYSNRPMQANGMLVPASDVYGHEQRHYKNLLTFGHSLADLMSKEGPPPQLSAKGITDKYTKQLTDFFRAEQGHSNPGSPGTFEPVPPELYPGWNFEKQQEDLGKGL